jgi:hypothetical protein
MNGRRTTVATAEELTLLRAIVDCDTERLDEMARTLHETEHLNGCEEALAAAFQVAVRMRFPNGHSPADVIRLVADTRIMAGPDGDRVQPVPMEFTVRSVLEDPRMGDLFGGGVTRYTQLMVCRFLAGRERLGDPDAFIGQVQSMLDMPTGGEPE